MCSIIIRLYLIYLKYENSISKLLALPVCSIWSYTRFYMSIKETSEKRRKERRKTENILYSSHVYLFVCSSHKRNTAFVLIDYSFQSFLNVCIHIVCTCYLTNIRNSTILSSYFILFYFAFFCLIHHFYTSMLHHMTFCASVKWLGVFAIKEMMELKEALRT